MEIFMITAILVLFTVGCSGVVLTRINADYKKEREDLLDND